VKVKQIVIIALGLSIIALTISIAVLLNNISESNIPTLPEGIIQVEVTKGKSSKVIIDSKNYSLSLYYFEDHSGVIQLKIETSSGSQIKNLHFNRPIFFYDLKVLLKERLFNSIIVWIEKS